MYWIVSIFAFILFSSDEENISREEKREAVIWIKEESQIIPVLQDQNNNLEEQAAEAFYNISALNETWPVTELQIFQREFVFENESYFIMRKFFQNNEEKYLLIKDGEYETFVVKKSQIWEVSEYWDVYNNSQYKKHKDSVYTQIPNAHNPLQNNGITHSSDSDEVFLTADFCPSSKHWFEKHLIEDFIGYGHKNIWIAITSSWIEWHQSEYTWLKNSNDSWELEITWINHTKTHLYNHEQDFSRNFILTPGLNLADEILDVEKRLLEGWQTPSLFIRYPWLVSDDAIRKTTIYDYGLIPLGTNAWLAKGEKPENGSVILIHGNKNEPYWIKLMEQILKKEDFKYWDITNVLQ